MGEDPQNPTAPAELPDPTGTTAVWKRIKVNGQEREITEEQAIRAVQQVGSVEARLHEARAGLGILQALQANPAETILDIANRTGVDLNALVNPGRGRPAAPLADDDDYEETTPMVDPSEVLRLQRELEDMKQHLTVRDAEARISRQMDEIKAKNPKVDMPAVLQFAAEQGFTDLAAAFKVWDYDRLEQERQQLLEARPQTLPTAGTRLTGSLTGTNSGAPLPGADKYRAKITTEDAFKAAMRKLAERAQ